MVSMGPDADRRSPAVTLALLLGLAMVFAIVATAGTAVATDPPPDSSSGAIEVDRPPEPDLAFGNDTDGTVPGTTFGMVEEHASTYRVRVAVEQKGIGAPGRHLVARAARRGDTFVLQERTVVATGRGHYSDDATRVAGVRVNDTGYRLHAYRDGVRTDTLEPHLLVQGNRTYERVDPDQVTPFAVGYGSHVTRFSYVRTGTVVRDGERLVRYEAVARRGEPLSRLRSLLAGHADVVGHVLVDRNGTLRAASLRDPTEEGYAELTYEARPGEAPSVPAWVDTARTLPPDPRENGPLPGHPDARAYRTTHGVLLVANGSWTPPEGARVTVGAFTERLERSGSLFRPGSAGQSHRVLLQPDGDGLRLDDASATGSPPEGNGSFGRPRRVIVDVNGVNHYDIPIRGGDELGAVGTVTAARLRPERGGGRALRVDDLRVTSGPGTPVTLTVGNGTVSRSLTVPAGNLSDERFYLVRTSTGLAALNRGGIAPTLEPPGGFADRRFVANASLTVEIDGIPIARRGLERRLTRADDTPLPELLTGLTVETYDEPPSGALLGRGDELRAMNWTDHTLVSVHVWDYDLVHVSGGVDGLADEDCLEDQTCFYRVEDGTEFRVETARDTVLLTGVADGTRTLTP